MDNNLLSTTIAATGIVATLGTTIVGVVKTVPNRLFSLAKQRFGYSINLNSKGAPMEFRNVNKFLLGLNKRVINNHILTMNYWWDGENHNVTTIDHGNYTICYKRCILNINRVSSTSVGSASTSGEKDNEYLSINIYGFKGKEVQKEILKIASQKEIKKDQTIIDSAVPSVGQLMWKKIKKRRLDTIYNPCIEEIVKYLNKWQNNKKIYEDKGLAYKTGILLYGEPGTGKSSIAKAIASYLDFNLIIITSIGDVSVINSIPGNSVVCFEDIDTYISSNRYTEKSDDKKDDEEKLDMFALSKIFNILDGPLSPSNMIFVATTNKRENLDKALIRKGRFDLQIEVKYLDEEYATKMVESFGLDAKKILEGEKLPIPPCELQDKILRNL